ASSRCSCRATSSSAAAPSRSNWNTSTRSTRNGWRRCTRGKGSRLRHCTMQLPNKRCLIVGGSTGLGFAAAERFLQEGARLVIAGRSPAKGAAAVAALAGHGPVQFAACDASSPEQVEALFREATAWLGGLDVLYHVAGISGRRHGDGPLHECTDDGW